MRLTLILTMLVMIMLSSACASSGNKKLKEISQTDIMSQLEEGKTTKAQVETILGQPNSISFTDSANEIWNYYYSTSTSHATNFIPYVNMFSQGHDVKTKELIILFNTEGVITKRTMRETTTEHKGGILGKQ